MCHPCISSIGKRIAYDLLPANGGQWKATYDEADEDDLRFSVAGGPAIGSGQLPSNLLLAGLGEHTIRIYDPEGGDYWGWSEPLVVRLIATGP